MNVIEVKNLNFGYDKDESVLKDVSFAINKGSYVSLVGHNGSGKSTLAKLLIGLLSPNSGEIILFDEKVTNKNVRQLRNRIGLVFQNPDNQFIGATVEDDIAFGLENKRVKHEEMNNIIQEFAKKVGMIDYLQKEPSRLSGGQKQRVAIAGALALSPEIIIFDEATSMLDPKGKSEIRELVLAMRKANPDLTILSITHDIEEAYLSDEVIIISHGQIIKQGKPEEILSKRDELNALNLEMPFILDLTDKLEKAGIALKNKQNLDEIVEEICQLK